MEIQNITHYFTLGEANYRLAILGKPDTPTSRDQEDADLPSEKGILLVDNRLPIDRNESAAWKLALTVSKETKDKPLSDADLVADTVNMVDSSWTGGQVLMHSKKEDQNETIAPIALIGYIGEEEIQSQADELALIESAISVVKATSRATPASIKVHISGESSLGKRLEKVPSVSLEDVDNTGEFAADIAKRVVILAQKEFETQEQALSETKGPIADVKLLETRRESLKHFEKLVGSKDITKQALHLAKLEMVAINLADESSIEGLERKEKQASDELVSRELLAAGIAKNVIRLAQVQVYSEETGTTLTEGQEKNYQMNQDEENFATNISNQVRILKKHRAKRKGVEFVSDNNGNLAAPTDERQRKRSKEERTIVLPTIDNRYMKSRGVDLAEQSVELKFRPSYKELTPESDYGEYESMPMEIESKMETATRRKSIVEEIPDSVQYQIYRRMSLQDPSSSKMLREMRESSSSDHDSDKDEIDKIIDLLPNLDLRMIHRRYLHEQDQVVPTIRPMHSSTLCIDGTYNEEETMEFEDAESIDENKADQISQLVYNLCRRYSLHEVEDLQLYKRMSIIPGATPLQFEITSDMACFTAQPTSDDDDDLVRPEQDESSACVRLDPTPTVNIPSQYLERDLGDSESRYRKIVQEGCVPMTVGEVEASLSSSIKFTATDPGAEAKASTYQQTEIMPQQLGLSREDIMGDTLNKPYKAVDPGEDNEARIQQQVDTVLFDTLLADPLSHGDTLNRPYESSNPDPGATLTLQQQSEMLKYEADATTTDSPGYILHADLLSCGDTLNRPYRSSHPDPGATLTLQQQTEMQKKYEPEAATTDSPGHILHADLLSCGDTLNRPYESSNPDPGATLTLQQQSEMLNYEPEAATTESPGHILHADLLSSADTLNRPYESFNPDSGATLTLQQQTGMLKYEPEAASLDSPVHMLSQTNNEVDKVGHEESPDKSDDSFVWVQEDEKNDQPFPTTCDISSGSFTESDFVMVADNDGHDGKEDGVLLASTTAPDMLLLKQTEIEPIDLNYQELLRSESSDKTFVPNEMKALGREGSQDLFMEVGESPVSTDSGESSPKFEDATEQDLDEPIESYQEVSLEDAPKESYPEFSSKGCNLGDEDILVAAVIVDRRQETEHSDIGKHSMKDDDGPPRKKKVTGNMIEGIIEQESMNPEDIQDDHIQTRCLVDDPETATDKQENISTLDTNLDANKDLDIGEQSSAEQQYILSQKSPTAELTPIDMKIGTPCVVRMVTDLDADDEEDDKTIGLIDESSTSFYTCDPFSEAVEAVKTPFTTEIEPCDTSTTIIGIAKEGLNHSQEKLITDLDEDDEVDIPVLGIVQLATNLNTNISMPTENLVTDLDAESEDDESQNEIPPLTSIIGERPLTSQDAGSDNSVTKTLQVQRILSDSLISDRDKEGATLDIRASKKGQEFDEEKISKTQQIPGGDMLIATATTTREETMTASISYEGDCIPNAAEAVIEVAYLEEGVVNNSEGEEPAQQTFAIIEESCLPEETTPLYTKKMDSQTPRSSTSDDGDGAELENMVANYENIVAFSETLEENIIEDAKFLVEHLSHIPISEAQPDTVLEVEDQLPHNEEAPDICSDEMAALVIEENEKDEHRPRVQGGRTEGVDTEVAYKGALVPYMGDVFFRTHYPVENDNEYISVIGDSKYLGNWKIHTSIGEELPKGSGIWYVYCRLPAGLKVNWKLIVFDKKQGRFLRFEERPNRKLVVPSHPIMIDAKWAFGQTPIEVHPDEIQLERIPFSYAVEVPDNYRERRIVVFGEDKNTQAIALKYECLKIVQDKEGTPGVLAEIAEEVLSEQVKSAKSNADISEKEEDVLVHERRVSIVQDVPLDVQGALVPYMTDIFFRTHYPVHNDDEYISVIGDSRYLGNWKVHTSIGEELPKGSGFWYVYCKLPADLKINWKLIVFDKKRGRFLRFEERPNRKLVVPSQPTMIDAKWAFGQTTIEVHPDEIQLESVPFSYVIEVPDEYRNRRIALFGDDQNVPAIALKYECLKIAHDREGTPEVLAEIAVEVLSEQVKSAKGNADISEKEKDVSVLERRVSIVPDIPLDVQGALVPYMTDVFFRTHYPVQNDDECLSVIGDSSYLGNWKVHTSIGEELPRGSGFWYVYCKLPAGLKINWKLIVFDKKQGRFLRFEERPNRKLDVPSHPIMIDAKWAFGQTPIEVRPDETQLESVPFSYVVEVPDEYRNRRITLFGDDQNVPAIALKYECLKIAHDGEGTPKVLAEIAEEVLSSQVNSAKSSTDISGKETDVSFHERRVSIVPDIPLDVQGALVPYMTDVFFRTHYPVHNDDEYISVIGDSSYLGNWKVHTSSIGEELPRGSGFWYVYCKLPADLKINWKLIVFDKKQGKFVRFEERPKRKLVVPSHPIMVDVLWAFSQTEIEVHPEETELENIPFSYVVEVPDEYRNRRIALLGDVQNAPAIALKYECLKIAKDKDGTSEVLAEIAEEVLSEQVKSAKSNADISEKEKDVSVHERRVSIVPDIPFDVQGALVPYMTDVFFRTHYPVHNDDEYISVIGDSSQLGNWKVHTSIGEELPRGSGFWYVYCKLPAGLTINWKLIVFDKKEGKFVRFEERPKRKLVVPSHPIMVDALWAFSQTEMEVHREETELENIPFSYVVEVPEEYRNRRIALFGGVQNTQAIALKYECLKIAHEKEGTPEILAEIAEEVLHDQNMAVNSTAACSGKDEERMVPERRVSVIPDIPFDLQGALVPYMTDVFIRTHYLVHNVDEYIAVIGDSEYLGNWKIHTSIGEELPKGSGFWYIYCKLPAGLKINWKLIVFDRKQGRFLRFEERPNRKLVIPSHPIMVDALWAYGQTTIEVNPQERELESTPFTYIVDVPDEYRSRRVTFFGTEADAPAIALKYESLRVAHNEDDIPEQLASLAKEVLSDEIVIAEIPGEDTDNIPELVPERRVSLIHTAPFEIQGALVPYTTDVFFRTHYLVHSKYEKVAVIGDSDYLGNWKIHTGIGEELPPGSGFWYVYSKLPAGLKITWKLIVFDCNQGRFLRFEERPNRKLLIPSTPVMVDALWAYGQTTHNVHPDENELESIPFSYNVDVPEKYRRRRHEVLDDGPSATAIALKYECLQLNQVEKVSSDNLSALAKEVLSMEEDVPMQEPPSQETSQFEPAQTGIQERRVSFVHDTPFKLESQIPINESDIDTMDTSEIEGKTDRFAEEVLHEEAESNSTSTVEEVDPKASIMISKEERLESSAPVQSGSVILEQGIQFETPEDVLRNLVWKAGNLEQEPVMFTAAVSKENTPVERSAIDYSETDLAPQDPMKTVYISFQDKPELEVAQATNKSKDSKVPKPNEFRVLEDALPESEEIVECSAGSGLQVSIKPIDTLGEQRTCILPTTEGIVLSESVDPICKNETKTAGVTQVLELEAADTTENVTSLGQGVPQVAEQTIIEPKRKQSVTKPRPMTSVDLLHGTETFEDDVQVGELATTPTEDLPFAVQRDTHQSVTATSEVTLVLEDTLDEMIPTQEITVDAPNVKDTVIQHKLALIEGVNAVEGTSLIVETDSHFAKDYSEEELDKGLPTVSRISASVDNVNEHIPEDELSEISKLSNEVVSPSIDSCHNIAIQEFTLPVESSNPCDSACTGVGETITEITHHSTEVQVVVGSEGTSAIDIPECTLDQVTDGLASAERTAVSATGPRPPTEISQVTNEAAEIEVEQIVSPEEQTAGYKLENASSNIAALSQRTVNVEDAVILDAVCITNVSNVETTKRTAEEKTTISPRLKMETNLVVQEEEGKESEDIDRTKSETVEPDVQPFPEQTVVLQESTLSFEPIPEEGIEISQLELPPIESTVQIDEIEVAMTERIKETEFATQLTEEKSMTITDIWDVPSVSMLSQDTLDRLVTEVNPVHEGTSNETLFEIADDVELERADINAEASKTHVVVLREQINIPEDTSDIPEPVKQDDSTINVADYEKVVATIKHVTVEERAAKIDVLLSETLPECVVDDKTHKAETSDDRPISIVELQLDRAEAYDTEDIPIEKAEKAGTSEMVNQQRTVMTELTMPGELVLESDNKAIQMSQADLVLERDEGQLTALTQKTIAEEDADVNSSDLDTVALISDIAKIELQQSPLSEAALTENTILREDETVLQGSFAAGDVKQLNTVIRTYMSGLDESDRLGVTGDIPELGNWKSIKHFAVENPPGSGLWYIHLSLPRRVSFWWKLVQGAPSGSEIRKREDHEDRHCVVPKTGDSLIDVLWGSEEKSISLSDVTTKMTEIPFAYGEVRINTEQGIVGVTKVENLVNGNEPELDKSVPGFEYRLPDRHDDININVKFDVTQPLDSNDHGSEASMETAHESFDKDDESREGNAGNGELTLDFDKDVTAEVRERELLWVLKSESEVQICIGPRGTQEIETEEKSNQAVKIPSADIEAAGTTAEAGAEGSTKTWFRTHRFVDEGLAVGVVGSIPELGSWESEGVLVGVEHPVGSGFWYIESNIRTGVHFRWKMVVVDKRTKVTKEEETRETREHYISTGPVLIDTIWSSVDRVNLIEDVADLAVHENQLFERVPKISESADSTPTGSVMPHKEWQVSQLPDATSLSYAQFSRGLTSSSSMEGLTPGLLKSEQKHHLHETSNAFLTRTQKLQNDIHSDVPLLQQSLILCVTTNNRTINKTVDKSMEVSFINYNGFCGESHTCDTYIEVPSKQQTHLQPQATNSTGTKEPLLLPNVLGNTDNDSRTRIPSLAVNLDGTGTLSSPVEKDEEEEVCFVSYSKGIGKIFGSRLQITDVAASCICVSKDICNNKLCYDLSSSHKQDSNSTVFNSIVVDGCGRSAEEPCADTVQRGHHSNKLSFEQFPAKYDDNKKTNSKSGYVDKKHEVCFISYDSAGIKAKAVSRNTSEIGNQHLNGRTLFKHASENRLPLKTREQTAAPSKTATEGTNIADATSLVDHRRKRSNKIEQYIPSQTLPLSRVDHLTDLSFKKGELSAKGSGSSLVSCINTLEDFSSKSGVLETKNEFETINRVGEAKNDCVVFITYSDNTMHCEVAKPNKVAGYHQNHQLDEMRKGSRGGSTDGKCRHGSI